MNSVAAPVAELTPSVNDKTMLQRVSEIASGPLAEAANRIDREGYYPLDIMARLAEVGAFGAHLDRRGADFGLALAANSEIARSCGSTGFLAWCHNVCGLYMEQSANPALLARLNDHVEGRSFGGTALSNPMKAMAGIEPMLLRAQRVPGGYRVSGSLPWVSHIAPRAILRCDRGCRSRRRYSFPRDHVSARSRRAGRPQALPRIFRHGRHQHLGHPPD